MNRINTQENLTKNKRTQANTSVNNAAKPERRIELEYLRTFVTIGVVFHYIFVQWLQFAFLFVSILPGILKGIIVTICSLLLRWAFTMVFRLILGVKQII